MKYDVIVVGGGTGGVASAINFAKDGFKVAIIEKNISLGGTQTNGLVTPFMPSKIGRSDTSDLILNNYEKFDSDYKKIKFGSAYSFNPELFAYALERLAVNFNIDIFYDTVCFDVQKSSSSIEKVHCINATQKFVLVADIFVDATGNLQLGLLAGVSKQEDTQSTQSVSLRFEISNIDFNRLRDYLREVDYKFCDLDESYLEFVYVPENELCSGIAPLIEKGLKDGVIDENDARYIQGFTTPSTDGLLSFNGPQIPNEYDIFDPIEYSNAIIKGHDMQVRLLTFFKNYIPGFEKAFISKSANLLGIRESVRLKGIQTPSQSDYANRVKTEDSIAKGDWYIDIHSDDLEVEAEEFKAKYSPGEYYDISYGSLITEQLDNYISIGRHISSTFEMQSSIRIQYTIYMMADKLPSIYKYCLDNDVKLNDLNTIRKGYFGQDN